MLLLLWSMEFCIPRGVVVIGLYNWDDDNDIFFLRRPCRLISSCTGLLRKKAEPFSEQNTVLLFLPKWQFSSHTTVIF